MLSISTKQNTKLVEVDGFTYKVRRPGAGESLTMQKSSREITKLGNLDDLSDAQKERAESNTLEVLEICLSLFDSDDKKALNYLKTLDAEVLMDVINQVFELKDEPTNAEEATEVS